MEKDSSGMIIVCVIVLIINLVILKYDTLFGIITFIFFGLWAFLFLAKNFIEIFKK